MLVKEKGYDPSFLEDDFDDLKDFWYGLHFSHVGKHLSMSNPREGRGGGSANHGNLTVAYIPRVGILIGHHAFDLSILCSRREVNHLFLLILTIRFCPGVGILIIFSPMSAPPPPLRA